MARYSSLLLTALLTAGLMLTGCDSSGSANSSDGSGTLQLTMSGSGGSTNNALQDATTNAPPSNPTASDVDTARVTITEISIVPSADTSRGDSTDIGVTALTDSNFTVDLKNLQSGINAALPEIEIPAGTYSQLRLITADEAEVSFTSTTGTEPVMIASGSQTGLKLNFPDSEFTVDSADDRVDITVNWDVTESLRGAPQGQYVITPAINDVTVNVTSAGN